MINSKGNVNINNGKKSILNKLLKKDISDIKTDKLLSILLSSCTKSKSSLQKGKKLLKEFNTLYGLGKTNINDLIIQGGIEKDQAILLKIAIELGKRWVRDSEEPLIEVNHSYEVYKYIYPQMGDLSKEIFKVLLLNSQNQIIKNIDAFKGTVIGAPVYVREVLELGLKYHAASFIFVHNHPSGSSTPSRGDILLTKRLVIAGEIIRIPINDHIIIGKQEYFSFLDQGFVEEYKELTPDLTGFPID